MNIAQSVVPSRMAVTVAKAYRKTTPPRMSSRAEPIASTPDDEVVAEIAPNLQRYIDGDFTSGPPNRIRTRYWFAESLAEFCTGWCG
jgi:hypothetical protein